MPILKSNTPSFPLERHHVGLEATQGLPNGGPIRYTPAFFGASREYADDEGWVRVRNGRRHRRTTPRS